MVPASGYLQLSWNWRKILEVLILGQFVVEKVCGLSFHIRSSHPVSRRRCDLDVCNREALGVLQGLDTKFISYNFFVEKTPPEVWSVLHQRHPSTTGLRLNLSPQLDSNT